MRNLATWLWPLAIVFLLASLLHGRLLENDNILADHALTQLVRSDSLDE